MIATDYIFDKKFSYPFIVAFNVHEELSPRRKITKHTQLVRETLKKHKLLRKT